MGAFPGSHRLSNRVWRGWDTERGGSDRLPCPDCDTDLYLNARTDSYAHAVPDQHPDVDEHAHVDSH